MSHGWEDIPSCLSWWGRSFLSALNSGKDIPVPPFSPRTWKAPHLSHGSPYRLIVNIINTITSHSVMPTRRCDRPPGIAPPVAPAPPRPHRGQTDSIPSPGPQLHAAGPPARPANEPAAAAAYAHLSHATPRRHTHGQMSMQSVNRISATPALPVPVSRRPRVSQQSTSP